MLKRNGNRSKRSIDIYFSFHGNRLAGFEARSLHFFGAIGKFRLAGARKLERVSVARFHKQVLLGDRRNSTGKGR